MNTVLLTISIDRTLNNLFKDFEVFIYYDDKLQLFLPEHDWCGFKYRSSTDVDFQFDSFFNIKNIYINIFIIIFPDMLKKKQFC